MRFERLSAKGQDPSRVASQLRALVPAPQSVTETVSAILADVRLRGDAALTEYTQRFDTPEPGPLIVEPEATELALERLDPAVRAGLELAIANVSAVADSTICGDFRVPLGDHEVRVREVPVDSAAVYVPGGRAPYPSTVVMGVVTAIAAGVPDIAVCSPPPCDDVVLAACRLTGVSRIFRMGGAQAIAALAYGTETVSAVDVVVGPGNLFVQEAKRQVSDHVGIDGFAGPSDLIVIADGDADPEPLVLDLLAQAEHGPGTLVIAISTSADLLDALAAYAADAPETGALLVGVEVADAQQGLAIAQAFAPEHLQLVGPQSEALATSVTRAGCVFVGPNAGTAFGDYIAGSNHILPTNGAARFASQLSPTHFRRRFSEVRISDPARLARAAAPIARAEGFEYHARSMEQRIRDNPETER